MPEEQGSDCARRVWTYPLQKYKYLECSLKTAEVTAFFKTCIWLTWDLFPGQMKLNPTPRPSHSENENGEVTYMNDFM